MPPKDKDKGKDKKGKDAKKGGKGDKVPKILKAGSKEGKAKKKKWSKTKSKDKVNNQVFWTKAQYDKLLKDIIPKEPYITPSVISEKLKLNVSLARLALKELVENGQLAPATEYHSKYSCFVKTDKFVAPVEEKKETTKAPQKAAKGNEKKAAEKK